MIDTTDRLPWPAARVDLADVRSWIAEPLPGQPPVDGPVTIHRSNEWGVTARFATGRDHEPAEVVFKANFLPPSFTGAAVYEMLGRCCPADVPAILGSVEEPGRRWELFRVFEGNIVGDLGTLEPLLDVARTIACIQATVAGLAETETIGIPRVPVDRMPGLFDELLPSSSAGCWVWGTAIVRRSRARTVYRPSGWRRWLRRGRRSRGGRTRRQRAAGRCRSITSICIRTTPRGNRTTAC